MDIIEALIPFSLFLVIFGIFYLYFTGRHRERMALIDKGLEANLLHRSGPESQRARRAVLLNIALTLIGIGLGITLGIILYSVTGQEAVYPASIFVMAGLGLLISFMLQKRSSDEQDMI